MNLQLNGVPKNYRAAFKAMCAGVPEAVGFCQLVQLACPSHLRALHRIPKPNMNDYLPPDVPKRPGNTTHGTRAAKAKMTPAEIKRRRAYKLRKFKEQKNALAVLATGQGAQ